MPWQWADFCFWLTRAFVPDSILAKLHDQLTHLQQASTETMQVYSARVRSYVQDLMLYKSETAVFHDTNLLQHFVNGFHLDALKSSFKTMPGSSFPT
mmetsp:Transcript_5737/g.13347  ORF Transcript_5737/g.13347 Transcript_5737/m.13347 type:complete len:97 (+) Transcript_5737:1453-1743(+)